MRTRGFTIIEIIIVMGIVATITGMISVSLFSSQHKASINSTLLILQSDLRQQQQKAMTGDVTNIGAVSPCGIHFDANKYTLFCGTFSSGNSANFEVELENNLSVSSTPSNEILFSKGSGEIPVQYEIKLSDNFNNSKTLYLNKLGVITGQN